MLIFIDIYIVFILCHFVGSFQFNHCNKTDPCVRFFPDRSNYVLYDDISGATKDLQFQSNVVNKIIGKFFVFVVMVSIHTSSGRYPAGNYIFKINNRDSRTRCAVVSLLLTLNAFRTLFYYFNCQL